MDHSALIVELPVEQRLALAYATRQSRPLFLGLFALDARLGAVVRQASEPVLGQIRLAWWRERLEAPAGAAVPGEPLLALLGQWQEYRSALAPLADSYELLLEPETLGPGAIRRFAELRAAACDALARRLGEAASAAAARRAGQAWAATDLAGKLSDPAEVEQARTIAGECDWSRQRLPGSMRPLAVLFGLARRDKGQQGFLTGPMSGLATVRLGLFGV
ncbi:MAG: hypothetical protein ACKOPG_07440 [Novosphingobium sp.]